jgi:hypothetical protein
MLSHLFISPSFLTPICYNILPHTLCTTTLLYKALPLSCYSDLLTFNNIYIVEFVLVLSRLSSCAAFITMFDLLQSVLYPLLLLFTPCCLYRTVIC